MGERCSYLRCRYAEDLLKKISLRDSNIVSVFTKMFVNCYSEYLQRRDGCINEYISLFSRYATEKLYQEFKCNQIKDLLNRASDYIKRIIDTAKSSGLDIIVLRLETVSRLTIHTRGSALPLELGLAWDPYINLPYIPSTSIKGVVRDYFEENHIRIRDYDLDKLFGSTMSIGSVVFYDAYPINCSNTLIEPDVLTPHYSEVRESISEVKAQPIPLIFPTVARGVVFHLPIVFRERFASESLKELIENIMKALERGVGAKTSVGYGFMRVSRA